MPDSSHQVGGLACSACGRYLHSDHPALLSWSFVCDCGKRYDHQNWSDLQLTVNPDQARLLADPTLALTMEWYHVTTRDTWEMDPPLPEHMVHLGTRHSALSRLQTVTAGSRRRRWTLFVVTIAPGTGIRAVLLQDGKETDILVSDAGLYVNRYEAPGDVSVVVPYSCVIPVSSEQVG